MTWAEVQRESIDSAVRVLSIQGKAIHRQSAELRRSKLLALVTNKDRGIRDRAREILGLVRFGLPDAAIAARTGNSEPMVKAILSGLRVLTGTKNRTALAAWAANQAPGRISLEQEPLPWKATRHQIRIMDMIARGSTNKDIADEFGSKYTTVKVQVSRILQRLDLDNRTQLAIWWNAHKPQERANA